MKARHVVTALAVLAAGTVAVAPAAGAPRYKKFSGSKEVTDATADPTGSGTDGADCSSLVPAAVTPFQDTPISIKVPALGKLKVSVANTGDWALEIRDPKGVIIGSSDGGGPTDLETATVKTKKAGSYKVFACNLGGHPTAKVSWTWTPA
ncbi:MAG TPA: hypothetical protein VNQ77_16705 [Frankiaceae bacterium]|nr:hypothetical protein [Frankiaceae bacterium]